MQNNNKTRSLYLLFILLPVILITGCFDYDEEITMNPDGSGKLFIHYQAERDMKFETLYFPTDRYDIEYNINKNYEVEGLESQPHQILQKEDQTHVYMAFNFNNLTSLGNAPRFQNEEFNLSEKDQAITLQRFLYLDERNLDKTKLLLKSGFKSIFNRGILEEIRFRFQWVVPGEIIDSNATLLGDKNRAIWTLTLAEILKNRSTQFFLTYKPNGINN